MPGGTPHFAPPHSASSFDVQCQYFFLHGTMLLCAGEGPATCEALPLAFAFRGLYVEKFAKRPLCTCTTCDGPGTSPLRHRRRHHNAAAAPKGVLLPPAFLPVPSCLPSCFSACCYSACHAAFPFLSCLLCFNLAWAHCDAGTARHCIAACCNSAPPAAFFRRQTGPLRTFPALTAAQRSLSITAMAAASSATVAAAASQPTPAEAAVPEWRRLVLVVAVVLLNEKGEVLLAQRPPGKSLAGASYTRCKWRRMLCLW